MIRCNKSKREIISFLGGEVVVLVGAGRTYTNMLSCSHSTRGEIHCLRRGPQMMAGFPGGVHAACYDLVEISPRT
jgi:hypothetical protein